MRPSHVVQSALLHGIGGLLAAIPRPAALAMGAALGIADDDWVWVISRNGRLKCQIRLMEGVNHDTVWTWNAIGKRAAWLFCTI